MKKALLILSPFTGYFSIVIFILIFIIFMAIVPVELGWNIGLIFVVPGAIMSFFYIACYLISSISVLIDLRTKNFLTEEVVYLTGYQDCSMIQRFEKRWVWKQDDESELYSENWKIWNARLGRLYTFFRVICTTSSGQSAVYYTSFVHRMEQGKTYRIQYGRYSHVIISIESEEGEEQLVIRPPADPFSPVLYQDKQKNSIKKDELRVKVMKKKERYEESIRPFIWEFICSWSILIGCVILSGSVEVNGQPHRIFMLCCFFFLVILGIGSFIGRLLLGARLILDLLFHCFLRKKMVYVDSEISRNIFLIEKSEDANGKRKIGLIQSSVCRVRLADHTGKHSYFLAGYYMLEKGRAYTVVYGKYSGIIVSIESKEEKEKPLIKATGIIELGQYHEKL